MNCSVCVYVKERGNYGPKEVNYFEFQIDFLNYLSIPFSEKLKTKYKYLSEYCFFYYILIAL